MSIVLQGSTSGSVTLQEPAVAGTTVLTLPAVSGTVLTTTTPKAGNVIQVVSGTTSTQTTSSSSTFADISLSASITPSSSSSKILVIVALMGVGKETNNTAAQTRLVRDSTTLLTATLTGFTGSTASNRGQSVSYCFLDSPATTSSTAYKIQLASWNNNAIAYVNDFTGTNPLSTITLMEIAA